MIVPLWEHTDRHERALLLEEVQKFLFVLCNVDFSPHYGENIMQLYHDVTLYVTTSSWCCLKDALSTRCRSIIHMITAFLCPIMFHKGTVLASVQHFSRLRGLSTLKMEETRPPKSGFLKIHTAPHPGRRHSSQSPPWEPQILHRISRHWITSRSIITGWSLRTSVSLQHIYLLLNL
jgi:hypothetical protein